VKHDLNEKPSPYGGEREQWVKRYRASGQTAREFAGQHGLRLSQLRYWVYQAPKPPVSAAILPAFQEVHLPAALSTAGSWAAEIGLPHGTTVRLARETDVTWALALIDSLRRPCS
jgi:hypothetical protein